MKKIVILVCVMMTLSLNLVEIACAEELSVARRFGAGIQANILNFGIGPSAEYWITENLGIMGSVGTLSDYTSFIIRANYLLNSTFDVAGSPSRPYFGVGFAHVRREEHRAGIKMEGKGSGVEIYAGNLQSIMKNLYFRGEFIFSTLTLELSASSASGTITQESDWGSFSVGGGIVYYF